MCLSILEVPNIVPNSVKQLWKFGQKILSGSGDIMAGRLKNYFLRKTPQKTR